MAPYLNGFYFVIQTKHPIQIFYHVKYLIDQFEASHALKSKRNYLLWASKMSIVQANSMPDLENRITCESLFRIIVFRELNKK